MRSERIHLLNDKPIRQGQYVLYLMQSSQRLQCNLALCEAVQIANETELPLLVLFHLKADYPDANYRHFKFMTDGLLKCSAEAAKLGIEFVLTDLPERELYSRYFNQAAALICDQGYLRPQRKWRSDLAGKIGCWMEAIEDNLIVPIASASYKAEWSARTIRPKVMEKIPYFSIDAEIPLPAIKHAYPTDTGNNNKITGRFLETIRQKNYLPPTNLASDEHAASTALDYFIENKLADYGQKRNDPSLAATSRLSPYLHFRQISPLQIISQIKEISDNTVFIEELVVLRELAHNFVWFTPRYDEYEALPSWCRQTLKDHQNDPRPVVYAPEQLENAATTDPYWNAAMNEMRQTGYMENTMRMYWGKKIIEWSPTPEEAYTTLLRLNNRYFPDERNTNSDTGVAWCFGLHNRPWSFHPIFGTVRTMTG
ncbi:MAG: deoxyribodipyrimidine photo-lyase [Odoribacter splanchnicus]